MKQHHMPCLPATTMANANHCLPSHDLNFEPSAAAAATEVISGDLYLLTSTSRSRGGGGATVRCPVHVQIYRSCFGHYAVVSANLRAPATFLNLRSCNARLCGSSSSSSSSGSEKSDSRLRNRFRVELGGGEGQVIYFEVPGSRNNGVSVEEWARAFQGSGVSSSPAGNLSPSLSPVIPRNPIMPTLEESIEEEEEEGDLS